MVPMRSSKALEAIGYDRETGTLRVEFREGRRYDYLDVPPYVYDGLMTEAHPWTTWGEHIKATYRYRRVELR